MEHNNVQVPVDRFIKQSLCQKSTMQKKHQYSTREVCLFNKLNPKKFCTNKCSGLYLRSDVIMFISFVSLSFREVVEQVVALISGHLQDPKNECVTGFS